MLADGPTVFTVAQLKQAPHEALLRLARYLRLAGAEQMSHRQLAKYIRWELKRRRGVT